MPKVRCFLAFDIEDTIVLKKLISVQRLLTNTGAPLKIVKPENIHITMKFLGNISMNSIKKISNNLQEVTFVSFNAELKGIGVFPKISRPKVIWAGITNGLEAIVKIFDQIESILKKLGLSTDVKKFSPHLTLARIKSPKNKEQLINLVKSNSNYNIGNITIKSLKLKKSDLSPIGPIYTTLKQFNSKSEV